jgi:hypothetical protein
MWLPAKQAAAGDLRTMLEQEMNSAHRQDVWLARVRGVLQARAANAFLTQASSRFAAVMRQCTVQSLLSHNLVNSRHQCEYEGQGRISFTTVPVTCWARCLISDLTSVARHWQHPTLDHHDPHNRRNTKALSFVAPICSRRGIETPVKVWYQSARHDLLEPSRAHFLLIHDHTDFHRYCSGI